MDRRNFMQSSLALGLVGAGGLSFPGTSAAADGKFWFNTLFHGGDADAMDAIVKKIRDENPSLNIDLTQGSWTEYYAQLYNSVVAGEAPQLGVVDDFRYESVADVLYDVEDTPAGNILDLMGVKPDDFAQWDTTKVGGKSLGLPLDQNGFGLYYNKDIFKEAGLDPERFPQTREEFEHACDAITKIGKVAYHPALSGATRYIRRAWMALLWSAKGEYLKDGKAAFNDDRGVESLQYLVDVVQKRGWNKPGTDGINQFLAGELGILQNGTWFYLTVENAKINYGCSMPPAFFEDQVAWGGYHLLVLPKQSSDEEAALQRTAEFLKAFTPHYSMWGEMGGAVPLWNAALSDPELKKSRTWEKTLHVFSKAAADGVIRAEPRHPKITDVDTAVEPFTQEAYNGTMSVKDALARAEDAANRALES
ncbi:extracellular solute-binding protein [Jiella sonneratiae]|uniref:Extracellular solute-binding protein n=1 Tax=Jiella sonneratiae TaxID=2816856 RepID=A0ABS3J3K6_9HYPH|nr:extracellular solute-binding protein [Jiella sonneratiae]MBO0904233.1 extracellular solute-binding protein [Jiella sonneratiae]